MFDSTVGGTVLMLLWTSQLTPAEGMAAKYLLKRKTTTGTLMTFGFNPYISKEALSMEPYMR